MPGSWSGLITLGKHAETRTARQTCCPWSRGFRQRDPSLQRGHPKPGGIQLHCWHDWEPSLSRCAQTCMLLCCSGTQCPTFIRLGPGNYKNERATSSGHVPIRICTSQPGPMSKLRSTEMSDMNIQRQLTPGALSGAFSLPAGPGRCDSRLLTLFLEHDNGLICNISCSGNVFLPPWSSYLLFLMWTSAYECIFMPLLHLPCCHFLICIMRMKRASLSLGYYRN